MLKISDRRQGEMSCVHKIITYSAHIGIIKINGKMIKIKTLALSD